MGKVQRAHQSQRVPMGTGFRPLPILPKNLHGIDDTIVGFRSS
jgi:hypothetical protein